MAKVILTQQTDTLDAHSGLGDKPNTNDGLSATQLKIRYDRDVNRNKTFLNGTLIAELQANDGAYAVGYDGTEDNVGDMLNTIISAGTGTIPPDGSITDAKLATDNKVGSLASLTTTEKSSISGAVNELDADLSTVEGYVSGEVYAVNESEQTTSSLTYTDVLSLSIPETADYIVNYTAQYRVSNGGEFADVQILHNAVQIDYVRNYDGYSGHYLQMSGFTKISASSSDIVKIQFVIGNASDTGTIKNCRISAKKYTGS